MVHIGVARLIFNKHYPCISYMILVVAMPIELILVEATDAPSGASKTDEKNLSSWPQITATHSKIKPKKLF
jgi:hypothetical protein